MIEPTDPPTLAPVVEVCPHGVREHCNYCSPPQGAIMPNYDPLGLNAAQPASGPPVDVVGDGLFTELCALFDERAAKLHKVGGPFVHQLAVVAADFTRRKLANVRTTDRPAGEQDKCSVCDGYAHRDYPQYKVCNNCWIVMPWRDDGRVFHHKEYPYACGEHNEIIVTPVAAAPTHDWARDPHPYGNQHFPYCARHQGDNYDAAVLCTCHDYPFIAFRAGVAACVEKVKAMVVVHDTWCINPAQCVCGAGLAVENIIKSLESLTDSAPAPAPAPAQQEVGSSEDVAAAIANELRPWFKYPDADVSDVEFVIRDILTSGVAEKEKLGG